MILVGKNKKICIRIRGETEVGADVCTDGGAPDTVFDCHVDIVPGYVDFYHTRFIGELKVRERFGLCAQVTAPFLE